MSVAALLILAAALGALLRRMMGGWLGLPRSLCVALLVVVTTAPAWWVWGSMAPWGTLWGVTVPMAAKAGIVTLLALAHWADGHRFDRPWWLLARYGWAPCALALLTGWWPAGAVGPIVALAGAGCGRWADPVALPWDDLPRRQMLDGWAAWWECVLGAVSVAVWWGALV